MNLLVPEIMDESNAKRALCPDDTDSAGPSRGKRRPTIEDFFGKSTMTGSSGQSTLHQYMEIKGPAPQVDPVVIRGFKVYTA